MITWIKTGRAVKGTGESTTYYKSADGKFEIQSRKLAIPHSGREGYWLHTSYFLIADGHEKEFHSLKDAKTAAERHLARELLKGETTWN